MALFGAAIAAAALGALVAIRLWTGPLLVDPRRGPAGSVEPSRPRPPSPHHERPARAPATPALLPGPPPRSPDPAASDEEARRERAAFTLASYLEWAHYPPSSRPARERPDRLRPHAVSPRTLPLSGARGEGSGRGDDGTVVVAWQSHVYLAGREQAALSVACRRGGEPIACSVVSAEAVPEVPTPGRAPAPVTFADDGTGPDRVAGDGVSTAMLTPGQEGFAGFTGPLRVRAEIEAAAPGAGRGEGAGPEPAAAGAHPGEPAGPEPAAPERGEVTGRASAAPERGEITFAFLYTADPPATFTGTVRERLVDGSLQLCVGLEVREPGRYVLDARAGDARGETFAFLSFNDMLPGGAQEACFRLFGKLVLDERAAAPFTLRDLEGFLLLEDTFPDRRSLPTWEGIVHKTHSYRLDDFSEAPWESDTKARHVAALRAPSPSPD